MIKILIGAVLAYKGLSGEAVLIGTDSSEALAIAGICLIVWGIVRRRSPSWW